MAGAGYKLFNTGDVLTAAQVNTYLMQQTVMVFASSAARTSALSGVLAEGMVSYLQDTNTLEVYDGSAWVGATGDITGLTAGTGISISSATGPVPTITSDVATTFDAKGDLVVGTGADTFAKLTVGNSGDTIVADSSTATGLRYQQPKTFNSVINGNFDCWQRGTSFAGLTTYAYTADRWKVVLSGTSLNATLSQDSSVPNVRSKYSAKLTQLTSTATAGEFGFHQIFETSNILPLCGNTVTLSFWYKSSMTGTHYYRIYTAYQTGGVDTTSTFTVSAADTWEYKTITLSAFAAISAIATAPTAAGAELQFGAAIYGGPARSITANGYVQVSQVQMEVGSVATVFARAGGTLAGEYAAAQRYYQKSYDPTTSPGSAVVAGWVDMMVGTASTGTLRANVRFPVQMRGTPTITLYDATGASGKVFKGANGKTGTATDIGTAGFTGGTNDATSTNELAYHYVAEAEL